jgi:hypothetical protein
LISLLKSKSNDGMNCKIQKKQRNKTKTLLTLQPFLICSCQLWFGQLHVWHLGVQVHCHYIFYSRLDQPVSLSNIIIKSVHTPQHCVSKVQKYDTLDKELESYQRDTARTELSWKCLQEIQTSCSQRIHSRGYKPAKLSSSGRPKGIVGPLLPFGTLMAEQIDLPAVNSFECY